MSKSISPDVKNGRLVVGRRSGAKFNAVEGLHPSPRVRRLERESDVAGETGAARRDRIRREFKK